MCTDCPNTSKSLNEGFAIVRTKAKDLALQLQKNVFVFKSENGYDYREEESARKEGIIPVEIVSFLRQVTT